MKKVLYPLIIFALVFSSCKKEEYDKILMVIEGVALNAKTGAPLEGVSVTTQTRGSERLATTNSNGYFKLGEFFAGEYIVVFKKDSFLSKSITVAPTSLAPRLEGNSKQVVNVDASINPLSESIKITIYKQVLGGVRVAVANQEYHIYLGDYNTPIKGTTDANGMITENKLPFGKEFTLSFDFVSGGITFQDDIDITIPYSVNNNYTILGSIIEGDLGIVSSNILDDQGEGVENFAANEDIVITFTQSVDTASITNNTFELRNMDTWNIVSTSLVWSDNNTKVTITPGTVLDNDERYRLEIDDLNNESNTLQYTVYLYFYTEP